MDKRGVLVVFCVKKSLQHGLQLMLETPSSYQNGNKCSVQSTEFMRQQTAHSLKTRHILGSKQSRFLPSSIKHSNFEQITQSPTTKIGGGGGHLECRQAT